MLKKIFIILGGIFLAILIFIFGMWAYTSYNKENYNNSAIPYIESTVKEFSKWDPEISKKYMSEQAIKSTKYENFVKVVKYLSKLGKLEKIDKPKYIGMVSSFGSNGKTLLTYSVNAKYEKGDAKITIVLLRENNHYKVDRFNVSSMALIQ